MFMFLKISTSRPFVKKEEGEVETEEDLQKQVRKKVDLDELDSIELNEAQKEAKWRFDFVVLFKY